MEVLDHQEEEVLVEEEIIIMDLEEGHPQEVILLVDSEEDKEDMVDLVEEEEAMEVMEVTVIIDFGILSLVIFSFNMSFSLNRQRK